MKIPGSALLSALCTAVANACKRGRDVTQELHQLSELKRRLEQRRDAMQPEIQRARERVDELWTRARGDASESDAVLQSHAAGIQQAETTLAGLDNNAAVIGHKIGQLTIHITNIGIVIGGDQAELPTKERMTKVAAEAETILAQIGDSTTLAEDTQPESYEVGVRRAPTRAAILEKLKSERAEQQEGGDGTEAARPQVPRIAAEAEEEPVDGARQQDADGAPHDGSWETDSRRQQEVG